MELTMHFIWRLYDAVVYKKLTALWIDSEAATTIDPAHKSHNALGIYPTMHQFVTEMCTHVHISVTK